MDYSFNVGFEGLFGSKKSKSNEITIQISHEDEDLCANKISDPHNKTYNDGYHTPKKGTELIKKPSKHDEKISPNKQNNIRKEIEVIQNNQVHEEPFIEQLQNFEFDYQIQLDRMQEYQNSFYAPMPVNYCNESVALDYDYIESNRDYNMCPQKIMRNSAISKESEHMGNNQLRPIMTTNLKPGYKLPMMKIPFEDRRTNQTQDFVIPIQLNKEGHFKRKRTEFEDDYGEESTLNLEKQYLD